MSQEALQALTTTEAHRSDSAYQRVVDKTLLSHRLHRQLAPAVRDEGFYTPLMVNTLAPPAGEEAAWRDCYRAVMGGAQ